VENACACGFVYTAHEHDLIAHSEIGAGCETQGVKAHYTCTGCDGIFADADGEQEMTADALVIPATGHTEVTDEASDPSCVAEGKTQGSHCSVCHTVLIEQTPIPKTDHTPVTVKGTAPNCMKKGLSDGSACAVCHAVLTEQTTLAPTDHTYGEWTVDVAPSEQYDGMQSRACTVCGETEHEIIEALGSSGQVADDAEGEGNTVMIVVIVVVVALVGGAGAAAFVFLRRR
jgi:rubredoxin